MKKKLNLGSGGIKGLILKHIEKAVLGIVVVLFVLLVVRSMGLQGDFALKPDELQEASLQAETTIKQPKPPLKEKITVPHWDDIARGIDDDVLANPYSLPLRWMHPLFPGATLRTEPEVFPLEELRAETGFGGIQMSMAGMGAGSAVGAAAESAMPSAMPSGFGAEGGMAMDAPGNVKGQRWVVLTGLLPYKKQWLEYGRVFRNAELKDPRRDVPQYIHYQVQRAEVTPGVDPQPEDWKPINVVRELVKTRAWAGAQPEVIFPRFLHPPVPNMVPMAFPLPPIARKVFGEEVAHEPQIPRYYQMEMPKLPELDIDKIEDDPTKLLDPRLRGAAGMAYGGAYGGFGTEGGGGLDYGMAYEQDYGAYGGLEGAYGYGAEGGMAYGDKGGMAYGGKGGMAYGGMEGAYGGYGMGMPRRDIPEYQLFRFFDFSVEPGKFYRYRVMLRLANPNYELPAQYLADEKLAESTFVEAPWSEETKTIRVPMDSRVLAGPVKPSLNVNVPPRGAIVAVHFDSANGKEVAKEFEVDRGQVLNFLGVEVAKTQPLGGMSPYGDMEMMMGAKGTMMLGGKGEMTRDAKGGVYDPMMYGAEGGGVQRPAPKNRQPQEPAEKIDYVTEMLVLDFLGGESLIGKDRDAKAEGRFLLMDPAGNLVMQDELDDNEEWVVYNPPKVEKQPAGMPEGYKELGGEFGGAMPGGAMP
jgi:hypothetical protein